VKANFLMSPPLVVAFALAGTVEWNPYADAIGQDKDGADVFLADIWPSGEEIADTLGAAFDDESYERSYAGFASKTRCGTVEAPEGAIYEWDTTSTYIQEPPFSTGSRPMPERARHQKKRGLWVSSEIR
jgi:aconitate hydratase